MIFLLFGKYECINIENFGNLVFPFNIENFRYWDESFGLEVYVRNNVVTTGILPTVVSDKLILCFPSLYLHACTWQMTANFDLSIFGLTFCKHVQASIWSNLIQFQGRKLVAVGTLQQVFMLGQLQLNTGHYRINFAQVFLHCVFEIFSTELQGLLNKTAIHCCTSIPHSCNSPGSISFLCYLGF